MEAPVMQAFETFVSSTLETPLEIFHFFSKRRRAVPNPLNILFASLGKNEAALLLPRHS
jgi:hypothetical protein